VSLVPRTARPLPVSPLLAGLRVLVTDDNPTYRSILAAHVGGWGMICTVCEDAATALQRLAEGVQTRQPYRIAIIDLRMPGMDGLHAAAAIRARTEHTGTAIILLTTLDTLALGRMSLDLDIAATLSKPIRETQLHDVLVRVISGVDTAQPALKPSSAMGITALKGRVLVVEDNAVNQRLASVQLGKLGLLADVAGDGAEALAALAQRPYDAVLMDCQMPGMDGYQTTRELRRRELVRGDGRRLPVIAMTANALEGDRERCLAVGMDDYVAKPVRIEALAETLERWLSRSVAPAPSLGSVQVQAPPVARVPLSTPFAQVDIIDAPLLEQVRAEIADDEAFTQMLEMFIREIPERCAQIVEALRASDLHRVRTLAHKLRGSCQILGAKRLAHLCAAMEQAALLQEQRTCQDTANAMPEVQAATLTALIARSH
jgi:two-component system sensor histidine kinase/response regulator